MKKNFIIALLAVGCLFIGQKTFTADSKDTGVLSQLMLRIINPSKEESAQDYYNKYKVALTSKINDYFPSGTFKLPGTTTPVFFQLNPLTAAIYFKNKEAFDWLLTLPGINLEATDSSLNRTPLHNAALAPVDDIRDEYYARRLLEKGTNIAAKDIRGNTFAHLAEANVDLLKYALKNKADFAAKNDKGETPLDIFEEYTDLAIDTKKDKTEADKLRLVKTELIKTAKGEQTFEKFIENTGIKMTTGEKVDDKELIDSLNALQNSLSAVVDKL